MPAAPVGPVRPIPPVAPVAPVAPVSPVAPVAPVSPVNPEIPCGPTSVDKLVEVSPVLYATNLIPAVENGEAEAWLLARNTAPMHANNSMTLV